MKKLLLIVLCFVMALALAACEIDAPTTPSTPTNAPSNAPTNEPTVPSVAPTAPSTEPTEPSAEPTEPSTAPTETSTAPTETSTEPTEPSTEPTEPSMEPTEPSTEPTEPHVHSFCEWGIAIAPSCESEGVKERSCDCGEKETESVPALGHTWENATCENPKSCSLCGVTEGDALGHNWNSATCDSAKTCATCGKTEGSAPGHNWNAATCDSAKTCATCGKTEGSALGHNWNAATCDSAKTCATCGKTEGSALGHNWNTATCDSAKTCATCGKTEGSALGHNWNTATCDSAKTCATCGKTEGSALGHNWNAATCDSPKICVACGESEGEALGHSWLDATCETAKICTNCGKTEGNPLQHTYDNLICTRCGESMRTILPVLGEVFLEYAMDCLIYNPTTNDWRVHNGVDIAAAAGAPVCAAADGIVYTVYQDDVMGMTVVIHHQGGYATTYSSLHTELCVEPGEAVFMGQTIGYVGNTALLETAAGNHVHFGVTKDDVELDPAVFIPDAHLHHDWRQATCESPQTCATCGKTNGKASDHSWLDATCERAKTCTNCGKTEGDPLQHTYDDLICTRCGEAMQTALPVFGEVVLEYAMDRLIYNPTTEDWRVHNGIDIAAATGTPVCAAADGVVYTVYHDDVMGVTVVIHHQGGYATTYSSLHTELCVEPGEKVVLGQTIGYVGTSALLETAAGDHVHFSVTKDFVEMDPADFVPDAHLRHDWQQATCESAKTCAICGKTEGEALGHGFDNGVCFRCGKNELDSEGVTYGKEVGDLCIVQKLEQYGSDEMTSILDTRGKITILNFWGTWCPYCVEEMDNVFPLILEKYGDDVAIMAVHTDMGTGYNTENYVLEKYGHLPITFCQDLEGEQYAKALGGGRGYPYTLILDRDGIIREIILGAVPYGYFESIIEGLR